MMEETNYQYWYNERKQIIGATINLLYADDAHYEFQYEEFIKLINILGDENDVVGALEQHFYKERPYYEFSDFLEESNIVYERVVFW
jgi:hypothetical protein